MDTKLRQTVKIIFEKLILNNAVFGKIMENVNKHRNIKFVTTERRRHYLVSEPNYYSLKSFIGNLLVKKMRKTQTIMNKLLHLVLSILDLNKIVVYEFCYYYVKPKYGENAKLI